MSSAVLFVLLFSQSVFAQNPVPTRYSDLDLQRMASFAKPAAPSEARREATERQREFEERFNQLLFKLGDFADHYNHGHTIDIQHRTIVCFPNDPPSTIVKADRHPAP